MGKRSNRRIFRRRRQRVGYALFVSLAIVIVGAVLFSSLDPVNPTLTAAEAEPVKRVEAPSRDRAPEPVSEEVAAAEEDQARAESSDNSDEGGDEAKQEKKEPEQAAGPPPIPQPETNDLWMDIPALGLNDNYVANADATSGAMDQGAIKLPATGFPWQRDANTYIAAHRLGYPGTESDYQFYNLPNLALGDKIYLYDANGTVYTYEVSGFLEVLPHENWVTEPQAGRDMISLQTCIEDYGDYWTMGPNWYVRYVVQADRVSVDRA